MKIRHFFLVSFLIASVTFPAFSQLRSYVGIVRVNYHESTVSFLEDLSRSMRVDGYLSYSEWIDGYLEGVFGSGYVYVAPDGSNYIITNEHVISQAKTATLEFENSDGTITKYEGLTVRGVDESLDLALLAFPDGKKPFSKGLSFYPGVVEDGLDVWSAGFPGTGGNPLWQLGKGTITNACARIAELIDPELSVLYQHSAPVDPGNSGGPLLVSSKASVGGYQVVGINTWRSVYRQAANYSIPAATVRKFIASSLAKPPKGDDSRAAFESRCALFSGKAFTDKEPYIKIARYVSNTNVSATGGAAFKEALSTAPGPVRDYVINMFVHESPIEGMRYAIAWKLQKDIFGRLETFPLTPGTPALQEDGSWKCDFSVSGAEYTSRWILEHGLWRIDSFTKIPVVKESDDDQKGKAGKQSKKT